eukprot:9414804-Ditylum_brightwellii.AAC.2
MHYVNNKNDFDAVDPKDAAIIASTTKVSALEGKLKFNGNNTHWLGTFQSKGKKTDKIMYGGKEWVWCKEHKHEGKYNETSLKTSS